MIRRLSKILLLAAVLGGPGALSAADNSAVAAGKYELKKRSTFVATNSEARPPFWPIGWVKRVKGNAAESAAPAVAKVTVDEKSFKVTSILVGNPSMAVINGRAYSEGELLRMPRPKSGEAVPPPMRIRVQRISDGGVVLQHQDQMIVASLQRPELNSLKPEELLLNEDR